MTEFYTNIMGFAVTEEATYGGRRIVYSDTEPSTIR